MAVAEERRTVILRPVIDRTRCEGGFHNECKDRGMPCLAACVNSVLEVRKLKNCDKTGLPFSDQLRILVHKNKQATVVSSTSCDGCGHCVKACPVQVIKLRRSGSAAIEGE